MKVSCLESFQVGLMKNRLRVFTVLTPQNPSIVPFYIVLIRRLINSGALKLQTFGRDARKWWNKDVEVSMGEGNLSGRRRRRASSVAPALFAKAIANQLSCYTNWFVRLHGAARLCAGEKKRELCLVLECFCQPQLLEKWFREGWG